ncbi:MAG: DEAD/DEAH box helicase [Anaerolineae bacterium]
MDKWRYSLDHNQLCQVIDTQSLWGETVCRVWLPGSDTVVRIPAARLRPLERGDAASPEAITYVAAAARVADALAQDVLLAPIASSVIPLPHQLRALSRAMAHDRVRYLLADEVGLGKTIEAGLILRELKLRGLVRRTLVVAPKGLVTQWIAEMRTHFGERFQLVLPEDLQVLKRLAPASEGGVGDHVGLGAEAGNPWRMLSQVVVPLDSVKPVDRRRGWTAAQVEEHNRTRFEDLIAAGWDLIIVDEAHRLGGSTDQVARYRLGQGLAEAAPYLLLLSATPHQGKTDAFHRLMSLVDAHAFPDGDSVSRERIQPYVIRTAKRRAIDAEGNPLFRPRYTQLVPVAWKVHHGLQARLYEAVTDYVREGYNQALREKRSYIGFLMILMQRLVVSSTSAIRTTLERRLNVLTAPQDPQTDQHSYDDEEWEELDGQQQLDEVLRANVQALGNEVAEVEHLLELAARCEQAGPDAKAEELLDWLYRLQSEENDPELKVLVFTEFVPTQEMLRRYLSERGFAVVCLNGSMDMEERGRVQEAFRREARILISTDAGGEGINLQFCHVVINYDIPWNPMRIEQRIGRVDRIGQPHAVRAVNLVLEDSVEYRVREVLEEKLAVILREFGVDKAGDVLDSAQAGEVFDGLYMEAILDPDRVEAVVDGILARLQEEMREARRAAAVLEEADELEPDEARRLLAHPLPHWVERMTVSYLRAHGGRAEQAGRAWNLTWPDGRTDVQIVFSTKDADALPTVRHLTLEDPQVRGLAMTLPRFAPGQPVPVFCVPGLAGEIRGTWSLWRISLAGVEWNRRRIMPLFVADSGRVYLPTARHIWDHLLLVDPQTAGVLTPGDSQSAYGQLQRAAEQQGKIIYEGLLQEHRTHLAREREGAAYALAARRRAVERIGLSEVRNYRLNLLAQEERVWQEQSATQAATYPEMVPLLLIRVEGTG